MSATLSVFLARKAMLKSVVLHFSVSIRNFIARRIGSEKTVFLVAFLDVLPKRLAKKSSDISSINSQKDGKTVSLSKKGYIHMRAHAHTYGPSNSEKSVFRLATVVGSSS